MEGDSDYDFDASPTSDLGEDSGPDYVSDGDDDDLVFKNVISPKDRKRAYEVDYTVHSQQEIRNFQDKESQHVAGIINIAPQHAATLLRHFHWNKENLIEKYMENPDKILQDACVILDTTLAPKPACVPNFTCEICFDDSPNLQTISLSCGHRFCTECYSRYLTQKIMDEGESRRITCMGACTLIVDEFTVRMLVDEPTYQRYQALLFRTYVDDSPKLRWCPAPNCTYTIECPAGRRDRLNQIVPTVQCKCGKVFCFGCGLDNHQPCICSLVKLWLKKCQDDSETANWLSANTKECPKCQSTIEKNGGCNHMTCKKCKYEWCWVCSGPWTDHGQAWYNCGRYNDKAAEAARDQQARSRASLERYLHYYNRYHNHELSAKLDKELYKRTERKMEEMQLTSELSWIEVQFLKNAVDVVFECRMTLKWTYAFAFYLDRNNMTELFESNQRDLEMAVEALSGLLESPIEPSKIEDLRRQVLDKSKYVQTRREVLLEDTAQGLQEGRWSWSQKP